MYAILRQNDKTIIRLPRTVGGRKARLMELHAHRRDGAKYFQQRRSWLEARAQHFFMLTQHPTQRRQVRRGSAFVLLGLFDWLPELNLDIIISNFVLAYKGK